MPREWPRDWPRAGRSPGPPAAVRPGRATRVDEHHSLLANRADWDRYADEYQATHGEFLGDAGFLWGPEGVREDDLHALGDVAGRRVLELGCGAGQCSRWVLGRGGRPVGLDVSDAAAPAQPQDRPRARNHRADGVRRSGCAPFRGRRVRRGLLRLRRPSVHRRRRRAGRRDRPGDPARRAAGVLRHPPDPLDVPRRPGRGRPGREPVLLGPHARTSRWTTRPARRPTSSTTAPSATGCAPSPRPATAWSTWSSRSGRPTTTGSGAAGAGSAACSRPGTALYVADLGTPARPHR